MCKPRDKNYTVRLVVLGPISSRNGVPSFLAAVSFRAASAAYAGTLKMRHMNLRDMKMRHHVAGVENARHENARNTIVWNTECCICLYIAEQECISPPTVFL